MTATYRYKAFLSYSHADKAWGKRVHTQLETYRTPKPLIGTEGRWGEVQGRLQPIFRDREELSAGAALGPEIQQHLKDSEFLLVICSPASARSHWVNEEIRYFRSTHADDRVLAIIVDGEPGEPVGPGQNGCFPPALLEPEPGSTTPREPIAADARQQGDGKRLALLKVKAGLLGVGLNDLVQRDAARRQRRLAIIAAASLCGTAVMMVLAIYANIQRIEADEQREIARTEADNTRAALDYLVSLFEIANPATENPKTITALTVLERGRDKIDTELADKPSVQGKLLSAIGQVYLNLGLYAEGEDALIKAIQSEGVSKEDRRAAQLELAFALSSENRLEDATALLTEVEDDLSSSISGDGSTDAETITARARLLEIKGAVAYAANDYDNAEAYWRSALATLGSSRLESAETIGRVHTNLGLLLANRSMFEASRIQLEAAIDIHTARFGERHVKTAISRHNLAFALFSAQDYAAAAKAIAEAQATYETALETSHPLVGDAHLLAGRILQSNGDLEGAAENFQAAITTFTSAFGENYHKIGWAEALLALAYADAGDFNAAFAALDAARKIYAINYPGDDVYAGDLLVHEAIVLGKSGQVKLARTRCEEGLTLIRGKMSDEDSYVQEMLTACAELPGN